MLGIILALMPFMPALTKCHNSKPIDFRTGLYFKICQTICIH